MASQTTVICWTCEQPLPQWQVEAGYSQCEDCQIEAERQAEGDNAAAVEFERFEELGRDLAASLYGHYGDPGYEEELVAWEQDQERFSAFGRGEYGGLTSRELAAMTGVENDDFYNDCMAMSEADQPVGPVIVPVLDFDPNDPIDLPF